MTNNMAEAETFNLDNFLNEICLASFKEEAELGGNHTHPDLGNFTCNCFVKEIHIQTSIENAKSFCKEKAIKKFNL